MLLLISNYKILPLILLSILIGCVAESSNSRFSESSNSRFYREDMLLKFVNNETDLNGFDEYNLILINASDCGACNVNDIQLIQRHQLYNEGSKTIFLFSQEKAKLLDSIEDSNVEVIYSDANVLGRYGLRLFTTYIFHINHGRIVNWSKLK